MPENNRLINPPLANRGLRVRELDGLSDREIVQRILDHDHPRELIQRLSEQDFFWLVKKVGEEEYLPLLRLATSEQRQYILDLEIWEKDHLVEDAVFDWLSRLNSADNEDLVWWLFNEGELLACHFLFRNIEILVREPDEELDVTADFFTPDDTFYVRVINPKYRDLIEDVIMNMFDEDSTRARALLEELGGVIPPEIEEEIYRVRTIRLAEQGFLPFHEAMAVFSPLDPESLRGTDGLTTSGTVDEETKGMVPVIPLHHGGSGTILMEALHDAAHPELIDRVRLEFAGLCNRIISADGLSHLEFDTLIEKCRKAAGYIQIALEKLCGGEHDPALRLIRENSLESLFRVGFGFAVNLKREARDWIDRSWFTGRKLETSFWGVPWGSLLTGLLHAKPHYFTGTGEKEYRDFERTSELDETRTALQHIMVLDDLLKRLDEDYHLGDSGGLPEETTAHALIMTFWARRVLKIEPGFSPLSTGQARSFFEHLRKGEPGAPFHMPGAEDLFVAEMTAYLADGSADRTRTLAGALSILWNRFREEYETVPSTALQGRYSRFIAISEPSE